MALLFSINFPSAVSAYNVSQAVYYARYWALSYNSSAYYTLTNNDCTNYVSQALLAGGIPEDFNPSHPTPRYIPNWTLDSNTNYWYHRKFSSNRFVYTSTWSFVQDLRSYLTSHNLAQYNMYNPNTQYQAILAAAQPGDIMQASSDHSIIISRILDDGVPAYCAHTSFRLDQPLTTFLDWAKLNNYTIYIIKPY